MRRSIGRNRGCKDALFERDVFGLPGAVRPASSRTPRFRPIGREVMACHDRMRLAWLGPRHTGRRKNNDSALDTTQNSKTTKNKHFFKTQ